MSSPDSEPIFSIVVPTRNESDNIEECINDIVVASTLPKRSIEIAIVDESNDETASIARQSGYDCVSVHEFEGLGLARSVIKGFELTTGQYIGVIDADGQHPPSLLFNLLESSRSTGAGLTIASRYTSGGGIQNWSLYRKVVSIVATHFVRTILFFDEDIKDPLSGLFVVKRDLIANADLNAVGYKLLMEILVKTDSEKYTEIPYQFQARRRGRSNLSASEYTDFLIHVYCLFSYKLRNMWNQSAD